MKAKATMKFKKAPGAPKRFKSAYMFYSEHQHKVIREQSDNKKIRAADVAKLVSQSWKELSDENRQVWVEKGRLDRLRYEREKAVYKGPWKVPNVKDPSCPKKPQSAFLAFGNERRKVIAQANPHMSGTEISYLLSKLWKECPGHLKKAYRDQEEREREQYKQALADWERNKASSIIITTTNTTSGNNSIESTSPVVSQTTTTTTQGLPSSRGGVQPALLVMDDIFDDIDNMFDENDLLSYEAAAAATTTPSDIPTIVNVPLAGIVNSLAPWTTATMNNNYVAPTTTTSTSTMISASPSTALMASDLTMNDTYMPNNNETTSSLWPSSNCVPVDQTPAFAPLQRIVSTPEVFTVVSSSCQAAATTQHQHQHQHQHQPMATATATATATTILADKVMNQPVVASRYDNYSLDDLLQDDELFLDDFLPSQIPNSNNNYSGATTIPTNDDHHHHHNNNQTSVLNMVMVPSLSSNHQCLPPSLTGYMAW